MSGALLVPVNKTSNFLNNLIENDKNGRKMRANNKQNMHLSNTSKTKKYKERPEKEHIQ